MNSIGYSRRLRSLVQVLGPLIVVLTLVAGASSPALARQNGDSGDRSDDVASVTGALVELSRQEESGAFNEVYDRIAPEARLVIPRAAVDVLYSSGTIPTPTDDPTVSSVEFGPYTWRSGEGGFDDAATVTYTQSVTTGGGASDDTFTRVFVNDGSRWRWLVEADAGQVEDATAQAGKDLGYTSDLDRETYRRIDAFWAGVFADAGLDYEPAVDIVGITREPFRTGCGTEDNIDQAGIYYCTIDEKIYYSPTFRSEVIDAVGSYAWYHIVAHEWGHHIQDLLNIDVSGDPELDGGLYGIELELQADCLAGIFEQDAFARGNIDDGEIDEIVDITSAAGDRRGTNWDDVYAHGTADQRVQSFETGYDSGFIGCNIDLEAAAD